jgi:hypothetical protein
MTSWIVLAGMVMPATPETVLPANRVADLFIVNGVYLNNRGPLRMMIDTGNSSSIVRPAVAHSLALHPDYAVQVETAAGEKRIVAAILDEVRIGLLRDNAVEAMIMDLRIPGVDGVLGQSWLIRHDYLLDYRLRRLVVDLAAPPAGIRAALRSTGGRPLVSAEVNGRPQELVVDSGTSNLVLFGQMFSTGPLTAVTNVGSVQARSGSARVGIAERYHMRLKAAWIDGPAQPGLLPAGAFQSVYISNRAGIVVFVP